VISLALAFLGHLAALGAGVTGTAGGEAELALIAQAVRGVPAAVRVLTRRLAPVIQARVMRVLRRLTPAHMGDADDVVQKVWVVLLKDTGRQFLAFDAARGISLEAYVGMIAEREVRNHVQHELASIRRPSDGLASLDEATEVPAPTPSPEGEVMQNDLVARLDAYLLAELPPRGQLVYRLIYADARSPDEAAAMLGCQVQVIYNWQHRVRTLSREFLAANG
jgi:RNA polymerase sigma factor (sigma-70 family)